MIVFNLNMPVFQGKLPVKFVPFLPLKSFLILNVILEYVRHIFNVHTNRSRFASWNFWGRSITLYIMFCLILPFYVSFLSLCISAVCFGLHYMVFTLITAECIGCFCQLFYDLCFVCIYCCSYWPVMFWHLFVFVDV